jgi:membrane dipeptidase
MALENTQPTPQIIIDAHQKIAHQALHLGHDYLRHPLALGQQPSRAGLPDALLGRLAVVFASIWTLPRQKNHKSALPRYETPRRAYELALHQWDYYQRLADSSPQIWLVRTASDLDQVLQTWQPSTPLNKRQQGLLLALSGADPILEPRQFEEWYERGVRCVGLAYLETRYSGSAGEADIGLTPLGFKLLDALGEHQVLLDLARISRRGFLEALDRYDGPLLISHTYGKSMIDDEEDDDEEDDISSRHLVCRLAERDGVVGVSVRHLGKNRQRASLEALVERIDRICQWTGSSAYAALGSNLIPSTSEVVAPKDIETTGDLWKVGRALARRGYQPADVEAILAGNWLRLLRRALP